jgi:hypothetical protein
LAKQTSLIEFPNLVDDFGRIYLLILFITGVIWAFIAINNFDTPQIFKLSLIYSLLLIFGFLGVVYDRSEKKLGLDSRIWEGSKLKLQLGIGILFFFAWYILFMKSGFSVASAQSVSGSTFAVSPTFNFILVNILGPLAENIFFFGVLFITLVYFIKTIIVNRTKGLILTGLIIASIPVFSSVPNSLYFVIAAATINAATSLMPNKFLQKHGPIFVAAILVGSLIFPKFHSYAYQLNERNYVAAQYFGLAMCIITAYIGLMPVDIIHSANNIVATSG